MPTLTTHSRIDEIPAEEWNRLADPDTPFLRHEFLAAMERHGCVGEELGWLPHHLALRDETGALVAAAPCYLKFNSYGEFVFDWSWADAYHRAGMKYYPKLVVASPYTPATGPRILTGDRPSRGQHAKALIRGADEVAERLGVSSLHWLFTTDEETNSLEAARPDAAHGLPVPLGQPGLPELRRLSGRLVRGQTQEHQTRAPTGQ